MIVAALALGLGVRTGQAVLDDVTANLKKVHSISVVLTTEYPKSGRKTVERFWLLEGGYMRYVQDDSEVLISPTSAWAIWPKRKTYRRTAVPPKGTPRNPFLGMPGLFGETDMRAIGNSAIGKWYTRKSIGIVIDAAKKISPKAKLSYFFAPDTMLPLGFHVIQGVFDALGSYSGLKINPVLKPQDFAFQPGKDWKVETVR